VNIIIENLNLGFINLRCSTFLVVNVIIIVISFLFVCTEEQQSEFQFLHLVDTQNLYISVFLFIYSAFISVAFIKIAVLPEALA